MNEQLKNLEEKLEGNLLRNDEVLALVETLSDIFAGITRHSNSNHNELLTIHELNRVSRRMSILFDMLSDQLEKTTQNNIELLKEVSQFKKAVDDK